MGAINTPGAPGRIYAAYGLTFAVPFPCLGLAAVSGAASADVVVREGTVPRALEAPVVSDQRWDAEPGRFLLRGGRRAGRFLVTGGQVTVERNPAAEEELLGRCFTQEVLPAVLRQRGMLVLHANAALTDRGAVLIAGQSGAGKSTSLAAVLDRGAAMLADDLTALAPAAEGEVVVLPGVAQMHLTAQAVSGLGYGAATEAGQGWRRMKSVLATESRMAQAPTRLAAIYQLETHSGRRVQVQAVTGFRKFDALQSCIYGPMLPSEHPGVFALTEAVTRTAEIYRVRRPAGRWTVPEVAGILLGEDASAMPMAEQR
jgi:hypothetical protein